MSGGTSGDGGLGGGGGDEEYVPVLRRQLASFEIELTRNNFHIDISVWLLFTFMTI